MDSPLRFSQNATVEKLKKYDLQEICLPDSVARQPPSAEPVLFEFHVISCKDLEPNIGKYDRRGVGPDAQHNSFA